VVCAAGVARGDTVYLKNGQKFEGKVLDEGDRVVVVSETGSRMTFPRDRVERIERGPAPWEEYQVRAAAVKADDVAGRLALARWCQDKKLHGRAETELQAVLKLDPENSEVHAMLGHEKVGDRWMSREDALKARGFVLVEGKWLSPEEYAAKEAQIKATEAARQEKDRLEQLGSADAAKAAAARQHYLDGGKKSLQNLIWAIVNVSDPKARVEAARLVNQIGVARGEHSVWLAQAAIKDASEEVIREICAGIKKRDDGDAMTYLVLLAAAEGSSRRKAAYCLRLIDDTRCYKALIGCIAQQPKDTLPGQAGMSLSQLGGLTSGSSGGGVAIGGGEVVPAADSMEFITGLQYKNNVGKWLKWLDAKDKAPGGAVVDVGGQ
jgi:hypothetical protein